MIKRYLFLCFLLISTYAFAQRQKYNFNAAWKVFVGDDSSAVNKNYNDNSWKNVTLPYAWNEDDAFKKDIVDLRTGIVWYRKHFNIPAAAQGQKIFLEFEGIRQAGEFYKLNVNNAADTQFELYDLSKDPSEQHNVADKFPGIVKKMQATIKAAHLPNKDWPLLPDELKGRTVVND